MYGKTLLVLGCVLAWVQTTQPADRPNVLWLTVEDMSPALGCYGDSYARTPNLDRFAKEAVRYTHAFATNPVCSPSRSCLITGVYSTSLGTQHLRSNFPIPDYMTGYPALLRKAGYHCSNNVKTDYNTSRERAIIKASWDERSGRAHWRKRKPNQPFFAIFNDVVTHQSRSMVWSYEQFRKEVQSQLDPSEIHDPAKAPLPPYYPDTPVVRKTVARFYDCVTVMDKRIGQRLKELEDAGVADDTIVFFYSDHGSGMPRHKRLLLDSGMHVPLMIRFPGKYQSLAPAKPGETVGRLVSFVDFPPSLLSLLGLPIPDYMQGKPFLGPAAVEPRTYVYGARDRVDEAYDLARSVRDRRYLYVRNYMPHISYNQPSVYSDRGEIRNEITRLAAAGELRGPALHYAGPTRAPEELYDTEADPLNLRNLVDDPQQQARLRTMREALRRWERDTRDIGFLPEAEVWARLDGATPFEIAGDVKRHPQQALIAAAELVGTGSGALAQERKLLKHSDPAVRYWAAVGLRALGEAAAPARPELLAALDDASPTVRVEAAGALMALGEKEKALAVLTDTLKNASLDVTLHACRTIELLGERARDAVPAMKAAMARAEKQKGSVVPSIKFSAGAFLKKLDATR